MASARLARRRARIAGEVSPGSRCQPVGQERVGAEGVSTGHQCFGGVDDQLVDIDVRLDVAMDVSADVAGPPLRVGEQLEGLFEVASGVVGSPHRHGLAARPDAGVERGLVVQRQSGVSREFRRRTAGLALAQRIGVASVQPDPLTRQQVVVRGLREKSMPEGVGRFPGDQHVDLHCFPEGALQARLVEARHGHQLGMAHPAAGDTGGPHYLPGPLTELVEADQQQIGEVGGQQLVRIGGADELLDEERISVRAIDDLGDLVLGQGRRMELSQELADGS